MANNSGETPATDKQNRNLTVDVGKLALENPNNVRAVYSNLAGIAQTPWDFQFTFSQIVVKGPSVSVELGGHVLMTPHHAKAFLEVLRANIEEFEKSHGEIKWPKHEGKPEAQSPHSPSR